jgi:hypothetical protein
MSTYSSMEKNHLASAMNAVYAVALRFIFVTLQFFSPPEHRSGCQMQLESWNVEKFGECEVPELETLKSEVAELNDCLIRGNGVQRLTFTTANGKPCIGPYEATWIIMQYYVMWLKIGYVFKHDLHRQTTKSVEIRVRYYILQSDNNGHSQPLWRKFL